MEPISDVKRQSKEPAEEMGQQFEQVAEEAGQQVEEATEEAKEQAEEAVHEASPWIERLARFGYTAKGAVYASLGALALQAALGIISPNVGIQDVLFKIFIQPFGRLLLALVAIGLLGYILWRFVQTIIDPDHVGADLKGLVQRFAYLVSGITYSFISYSAFELLFSSGRTHPNRNAPQDITAAVMRQPLGRLLIGAVGVILVGVGLYQFYRAFSANFRKRFDFSNMSESAHDWMVRLGRLGFSARSIVYLIIGGFLIEAAVFYNSNRAGGIGQALVDLSSTPFGPWLLGAVAVGLIAYGLYAMALARYRRINVG